MGEEREKSNAGTVFDKVKEVHKKISEQMWLLDNVLPYLNKPESYDNVRKTIEFFKNVIFKHFEWEEHDVFPVALAIGELDIKQVVRDLQQQHIFIISKFDILSDIIVKYGFSFNDEKIKDRFIVTSKEMLNAALQHSHKEDEDLYPFLQDKNVNLDFKSQS